MAFAHKIWQFPTFRISKQLFHVPGQAVDGGFTSGGARITSPEPGGYSMLEIQPSLITSEYAAPLASWLMSKTNGEIFRVRLAPTPQVATSRLRPDGVPWGAEGIYPDRPWMNGQPWAGDIITSFAASALAGSNVVKVTMTQIGQILSAGHVLGHANDSYIIDEIEYDVNDVATITVKPPLRRNVSTADVALFRPYFTGQILNPSEFRTTYDAEMVGNIQLGKIMLGEVIL